MVVRKLWCCKTGELSLVGFVLQLIYLIGGDRFSHLNKALWAAAVGKNNAMPLNVTN